MGRHMLVARHGILAVIRSRIETLVQGGEDFGSRDEYRIVPPD